MKAVNRYIVIIFITLAACIKPSLSSAQLKSVQFVQLDSLQKIEQRPVIVFLYTDWCKFCATMKNTTFKNGDVLQLLSNKFYFVSLNAEEKTTITFNGHPYKYKPTGTNVGLHEIAERLGTIDGQVAYPSICILNSEYEIIYQNNGFLTAKNFVSILKSVK